MIKVKLDGERVILSTALSQIDISKAQGRKLACELRKLCTTATKYGNKKVFAYNRNWDSKIELEFYEHLLKLHNAQDIIIQPKFILQEKQAGMREIAYIADFKIQNMVIDIKGYLTPDFKLKSKLFKAKYPNTVLKLITACPLKWQNIYGKWINVEDLNRERSKEKRAKTKASKVV